MADRLYTSRNTDDVLSSLRLATKLEKVTLARMAFALSLVKEGIAISPSHDFSGGEMKRPTFIGEDEVFIRTMISYVYSRHEISEEEFFSNRSIIKNHIDSGALLLGRMFHECENDVEKLFQLILKEVELGRNQGAAGHALDIFIGRSVLNKKELVTEINNTSQHANTHMAIMGIPGAGKTQFILKILADIRIQSRFQTHFIYFDYKGDVVDNQRFMDVARVCPYRLLQGNQSLPLNPFMLPAYDEQTINISAREKAESFASINSKLGPVQKGSLAEIIRTAYEKRAGSKMPFPDFQDIFQIAVPMYEEGNKNADSLIEVLRDLADFNLFWSHGSKIAPIDCLSNRTILIDLHAMPVLKELVVYLVIERLYKEMALMPDSPIKDDRRTIRTVLVIDEAHNYLGQKNIFLQKIIREGRSKGVVVLFASQSPNDYQQKFFNFQELLEFVFIFQSQGVSAGSIQDILGCSPRTAKDLQTEIARLEPWQVISRSSDKTEEFVKFTAEAFYKSYS
ncbi:MAG: DndE family protein [Desulfatirhabdiaceae bacterium]